MNSSQKRFPFSIIRDIQDWFHSHKLYQLLKRIKRQIRRAEYEKGVVFFDDREAEKRERFVQTYIILFGLLLSYGQYALLQSVAMAYFLLFLFSITMYYSILNSNHWSRMLTGAYGVGFIVYFINFIAVLSTFLLSYVLMLFFQTVGNGFSSVDLNKYVSTTCILCLCIFLCLPLLINRSMFK